ncbi:MAG: RNA polymerase sigma factor [Bacteroidales bacterium]|nr:RNA polymerase sigma factor [Bacteroidales bacterium]
MNDRDERILEALREDESRGMALLMEAYAEPVYWHVRRLVVRHEDAQDAVQEAFIRIYKSIGRFRRESALSTWVYRIATHEALRLLEKRRESLPLDGSGIFEQQADFWTDWADKDAVRLQKAILSLPRKQQLAFNLRWYDELGYEQIARITGMSTGSAKANYHFAKEKIIQYIKDHD